MAADLNIENSIIFTGFLNEGRKIELLNKAKVYVQPSFYESFCVGAVEAMSCKLPVVVSNNGALKEVVGNCGIYTSTKDFKELSNNIIKLFKNNSLRQKLGNRGRARVVSKFSYKVRKEKIKNILDQLVNWNQVKTKTVFYGS